MNILEHQLEKNLQKKLHIFCLNTEITENNDIIPNVTGMPAMDAISLLENFGLIVEVKGIGKVKKQSLKKGTPIKKGATIILNLS